ncbi:3,4-dihydroxy-2-butanone-4-phosphate synthase [Gordonia soli]|uniref:3,4-dihydroxy-2-butanone-4-phosphate synthase n=1 Tax=Gordonia soli NBRC 108243 TaxID=1223545 RepID=M0QP95_9ACTN|nr:3,4-dihydroxy-2-butanone-4-phosphate synthase [Gordonia soli]GAC70363.1 putative 3,4-dihydroxy-2-butanone 4-phosphate synthase [Gordonia soli NBRC 108243]
MTTASLVDITDRRDTRQPRPDRHRERVAVDHMRSGGLVVVRDDTDDLGRCDVVGAADRITTHDIALMVRHGSGFLQVAMRDAWCDHLRIPPVAPTPDRLASQQCVGVDAVVGTTTGISAADRARTIATLGDADAIPSDLSRPGHVIPVRVAAAAQIGDTAALALALAEAAGSIAAVFGTLVDCGQAGTGLPDHSEVTRFAADHGLPTVGRIDLVHARSA